MKVTSLKIPDVKLIEPSVFIDERGFFYESFNQKKFNESVGKEIYFVQDNHSKSKKGVLRGMHFQKKPYAQGKLIRVIKGQIYDVALDLREESNSYGQWLSEILSAENKKQLWIPEGFAHGFLAISDEVEIVYKTTNYYSRDHEETIFFNDQRFNITWPEDFTFTLSEKDSK
jgi:dTDP-4-dehydrorhamnose 3,5-epimerase